MRRDPLGELRTLRCECGDLVRVRFGATQLFFLSHPDAIRRVLVDEQERYSKRTFDYEAMKTVLGEVRSRAKERSGGSNGGPSTRRSATRSWKGSPVASAPRRTLLCARLAAPPVGKHAVDIAREMTRLNLHIVTRALFHADLGQGAERITRAVTLLNQQWRKTCPSSSSFPTGFPRGATGDSSTPGGSSIAISTSSSGSVEGGTTEPISFTACGRRP